MQRLQSWIEARWLLVLVKLRPPQGLEVVLLYSLYAYVLAFVTKWAVAWLLLSALAPDWLLPSNTAVSTIAQVLPSVMVSVFVFVLGAFFVVNQQATSIHSNRASLLLLYDPQVHHAVARALIISVAALMMALFMSGQESAALGGLGLALVLATAFTLVSAATLLPYLMARVSAPRNFALWAIQGTEDLMSVGITSLVVYRAGLLGEMLRRGVRSGDSLQIREALSGMQKFYEGYFRAAEVDADARIQSHEGKTREGWLGEELSAAVVTAGQEAIGQDIANEDGNQISRLLSGFGVAASKVGYVEEFSEAAKGLANLGTCTQQVKGGGLINVYSEPVYGLAALVEPALEGLGEEAAGHALALWALVVAYSVRHLGTEGHVHWERSIAMWPDDLPWDEAHKRVASEGFTRLWANKLASIKPLFAEPDGEDEAAEPEVVFPGQNMGVLVVLLQAQQEHPGSPDLT